MRVAMTSDNHFDINKVDSDEMLKRQAEWLLQQGVDYYLIAGDLFNDFERSVRYVDLLQQEVRGTMQVRWVAGNHDMLHSVTYDELESLQTPEYAHHRLEPLGTNWCLIANNGWYDYTLAEQVPEEQNFEQWKQAYWVDSIIKQPMSDPQRLNVGLTQTTQLLQQAQAQRRQVLFMTHFAPRKDYVQVHPEIRMWNMSNGMMGSAKLGQLLERYQVANVLFGHLHMYTKPRRFQHTTYFNQAVGYHRKRRNEWHQDNFFDQWREQLEFLNLI